MGEAGAAPIETLLLEGLTPEQSDAVQSSARRLLVVAGAGSGKTEVMARRIAWWIGVQGVPRDEIIAFTFTEKAAEEMKFRIRRWVQVVTPEGEDATLGRMYVGTIHGFCLQMLQELLPEVYGVFDVIDDAGRLAMVQRMFNHPLGLTALKSALDQGQFATISEFLFGYDQMHEAGVFQAVGPTSPRPEIGREEGDWIKEWHLSTDVGSGAVAEAFAVSAARYYGALHARRLLDFSTAQSELVGLLEASGKHLDELRTRYRRLVVDEFQDVNLVQNRLVGLLTGDTGTMTAVGDHRQAIYGWRGGRVQIMADWQADLAASSDGDVLDLPDNFRSTPRIIRLANEWADSIGALGTLPSPHMTHGNDDRVDEDASHVALRRFGNRDAEAAWLAETITRLVDGEAETGVPHDVRGRVEGEWLSRPRGIGYPDIAVLTRSSTDANSYRQALESRGIPAVVRGGPDLFQQPEVIVMLMSLCIASGIDRILGATWGNSLPAAANRMGVAAEPEPMLRAAGVELLAAGVDVTVADLDRLIHASRAIHAVLIGGQVEKRDIAKVETRPLKHWLTQWSRPSKELRRIFPQTIYQWLASELGIQRWDGQKHPRARTAMFHLGQLAGLLTGIETPGWVTARDLKWQMIALTNWGARNARSSEAPLLVAPEAVTISTIHSAKGLEFPVVFVADVASQRFPTRNAKKVPTLPYGGLARDAVDPVTLADNDNYDAERRLMYVALTRAERFLFVSAASKNRSQFEKELEDLVGAVGGEVYPTTEPTVSTHIPTEVDPTFRLVTSFSDLRYYIECPHDYYLRKVLGFAPTIDQAFGYGRGVHNMMRAVHLDPARNAELAEKPAELEAEVQGLIDDGLFYLRYTTGAPLDNMKKRAKEVVTEYVTHYKEELATLEFEPERAFETLIEEAGVLVSGAIDLIRHDSPPRVALIDFKSGDPEKAYENASALDKEQMQLQITLYGIAAKKELEYEPDLGLVRYLGVQPGASTDERELKVPLDDAALAKAHDTVVEVARGIQGRKWNVGPQRPSKNPDHKTRCEGCDFLLLCGRPEAAGA
jgi:DNA helicase-2/ATP-dependent DNA helicase PcrA